MNTNAIRFAAGLGLFAAGAPFPAFAQFIYPPVLVVPPPAENYMTPKLVPRSSPDKSKPAQTPTQTKPGGHYEGRTYVPD
jgi:hypothetical protein